MPVLQRAFQCTVMVSFLALAGCRGNASDVPATPAPSVGRVAMAPLPTPTITPLPSATPLPTETPIPLDTPVPTGLPAVLGPADLESTGACAILREPGLVELSVAPWMEGSDDALARESVSFVADVTAHDNLAREYLLMPTEPDGLPELVLRYAGAPLPLEPGSGYTFRWTQAQYQPTGSAVLRVDDADGVLFPDGFGASGPADQLIAADLGGFAVRQLPTLCQYTETDECGFESRAAPFEAARGDRRVAVSAGESGLLESDPPYRLSVFTSHIRRWVRATPGQSCTLPNDWPQSWRLDRVAPGTSTPE